MKTFNIENLLLITFSYINIKNTKLMQDWYNTPEYVTAPLKWKPTESKALFKTKVLYNLIDH